MIIIFFLQRPRGRSKVMGGNRSTGPEMLEIMSRSDVSPEDDSAMRTLVKPQSLGYGTALEMLHASQNCGQSETNTGAVFGSSAEQETATAGVTASNTQSMQTYMSPCEWRSTSPELNLQIIASEISILRCVVFLQPSLLNQSQCGCKQTLLVNVL
ncbi:hypothetical protein F2P81_023805 [Scophthalmus maximus]|uniref:Uncharacterized protein n=1 Tax=Scophthalmus maximus TaxID=52904 RepID=A0A6A4RSM6_SCOMX|nr:hypothetical protein F2P81_023805 [Scophthalmus maximus]